MTEQACVWCQRTDTPRVPVNATIGGRSERCADADECMAAKKQRDRDLNSRFLGSRGFQQ